ncbi:NAD(P)/FAD-dependent oxidoreductase [Candidatus Woesearchaeota archaeon]|nr:NAD(P)/FAD-dependent oxidoreductase [Candidatus Woesearchaeota archaeon]
MSSSEKQVTIVGAGPVGCYLGHLLSKEGVPTTIIEDNAVIGSPEQCTGLFNINLDEFIKPKKDHVLNMIKGAALCCGKASVEIKAKEEKAYVYDRIKFDQYLASLAMASGAAILTKTRFASYTNHTAAGHTAAANTARSSAGRNNSSIQLQLLSENKPITRETSLLVGADGPNSAVAKSAGIFGSRRYWIGNQVFLAMKKPWFDKELAYLFFDKKYHEDFFAWVVPMDEYTAKVGTASYKNSAAYLGSFLKDKFAGATIIGRQGGLIPYYDPALPCQKENDVFLVGDAAFQVKATTGGGIVPGFAAAQQLKDAVAHETYDYGKRMAAVRRNLWLHLMMRKKMNRFSDKDYEELISTLGRPPVHRILAAQGDNDYPHKFLLKMLFHAPSLMKFCVK